MRNRKVQREMRRMYGKGAFSNEEKLDLHDYCGIKDPTPYLAVKNIIDQEKAEAVAKARAAVAARERVAARVTARPAVVAATSS